MNHHPNPNKNAPSTMATIAPNAMHDTNQNPRGNSCLIDLPDFLSEPAAPPAAANSTAGASTHPKPATAVAFFSTPGMACNAREQNSELCISLPSFLHCARPAHEGMKPDLSELVISINSENVERTQ